MTNKEAIRVLEQIKKHPSMEVYLPDECEALELAIKALEERPQGEWKETDISESTLCKCSVCGFDLGAYSFNFCPNCGADMRGGTE